MNSRNTELVDLLIDFQKLGERFSDICSSMTPQELKRCSCSFPDVENYLEQTASCLSDIIFDYYPPKKIKTL